MGRKLRTALVLVLVVCHDAAAVPHCPPAAPRADAVASAYTRSGRFAGVVLLARDDQILLRKAYGLADRGAGRRLSPETQFPIGSLTKSFTAAAILQLRDRGRLRLADSLRRYFPSLPSRYAGVTLHHLLGVSFPGIPDYAGTADERDILGDRAAPGAILAFLRHRRTAFRPGSRFEYSNTNYALLGYIIERVSGEPFAAYVQSHLLVPAEMRHTAIDVERERGDGFPLGYRRDGRGRMRRMPALDISHAPGDGALKSTVDDLYRWDRALAGNALLAPESRRLLFAPNRGGYGYGWSIDRFRGARRIEHDGLVPGFTGRLARFPDAGTTVVVLSNVENADTRGLVDALAGAALCPVTTARLARKK